MRDGADTRLTKLVQADQLSLAIEQVVRPWHVEEVREIRADGCRHSQTGNLLGSMIFASILPVSFEWRVIGSASKQNLCVGGQAKRLPKFIRRLSYCPILAIPHTEEFVCLNRHNWPVQGLATTIAVVDDRNILGQVDGVLMDRGQVVKTQTTDIRHPLRKVGPERANRIACLSIALFPVTRITMTQVETVKKSQLRLDAATNREPAALRTCGSNNTVGTENLAKLGFGRHDYYYSLTISAFPNPEIPRTSRTTSFATPVVSANAWPRTLAPSPSTVPIRR